MVGRLMEIDVVYGWIGCLRKGVYGVLGLGV